MLILAILLILIYFSTKHQKTDGLLEKLDVVTHQEVKPVKEKKVKKIKIKDPNKPNWFITFLKSDGFKSFIASVICVLLGLVIGIIVI